MHRIDSATAEANTNGTGKNGFTDGTVPTIPPTDLTAKWFNAVQEEIASVVEDAGTTLDDTDRGQLLSALNKTLTGLTSITSAAGTTTLTAASSAIQIVTGSTTQVIKLPDETTLSVGRTFHLLNVSTGTVSVRDSGNNALFTIQSPIGTNRAEYAIVRSKSAGAATGNWVYSYNVPGQLHGTVTNDTASAGNVGEPLRSSRVLSNATSQSGHGTTFNICTTPQITLTPGDWDVRAAAGFVWSALVEHDCYLSISKTSATLSGSDTTHVPTAGEFRTRTSATDRLSTAVIPSYRVSVSTNTDLYLVGSIDTANSSDVCDVHGWLEARRAR